MLFLLHVESHEFKWRLIPTTPARGGVKFSGQFGDGRDPGTRAGVFLGGRLARTGTLRWAVYAAARMNPVEKYPAPGAGGGTGGNDGEPRIRSHSFAGKSRSLRAEKDVPERFSSLGGAVSAKRSGFRARMSSLASPLRGCSEVLYAGSIGSSGNFT